MADLDHTGRKLGGLVLRERIGGGGHGTVYRTEQRELGRDAVVKVLRPQPTDSCARERFMREAMLASRFDHPYSAHVYAHGIEEDGVQWIAMELVRGVSLKERGPMSLAEFVPFFECVAAVVHAAHKQGIVHRDLKPSNVMVIDSDGQLLPKLLDFGIAKVFDVPDDGSAGDAGRAAAATAKLRRAAPERTRSDADPGPAPITARGVLGSLPYISPEQWKEPSNVSPSSDIYALGCLVYEVLTGRTPFTAETAIDYYHLHLKAEVPPLGEGFPPDVERAIRRALAKSPDERQATALEFAADLRAALHASPHEKLNSAAQQWDERGRSPGFLWERERVAEVRHSVAPATMTQLECAFVAASERRSRRVRWTTRLLVAAAAAGAIVAFGIYQAMQARLADERAQAARKLAEAKVTESTLERGRSALLHGESEAQRHLADAYKRDPSPATAFMLARAMQPRLNELARLPGTYGRTWWATFSPDGSRIAVADDRAAQIWDGTTYQLLYTLPHGREVYQALYAPGGTSLITVTETALKVWDARNGTLVRDLVAPPGRRTRTDLFRASISPDGQLVAAMDADGAVTRVWGIETGDMVAELHDPHPDGFLRIAFSPKGYLATTGGNEAHVFDIRTWRRVLDVPGQVRGLAFETSGSLATGSAAGDVSLWEIPSGLRLRHLRQSGEGVEVVAFSADGELVAAGGRDGALQVWRTGDGALKSQFNARRSRILALDFGPTPASLLAAHADGTVVVADVAQGLPTATLDGPRNALRTASFGPGGQIVGASRDGAARVWDAASPYRQYGSTPMSDDCGIVIGAQADGRFIAVGCGTLPTRVWDTAHDQLLAELPSVTPIADGGFTSAFPAVSARGDRAAIARGNTVELYALPGGGLLRRIELGAPVSVVAFASTGRDLVSGAIDGSMRVTRDDGTDRALQASAGVDAAELLPDGRVVASDANRRLRVFGPSGVILADLETPVRLMSLRREDVRLVALPSYLAPATAPLVFDLDQLRVVARLEGHIGQVFSARWMPGGRVVTAGADGTVRLWDSSTGALLRTYQGGPGALADAILTPDGLAIGGDADGLLRFWDASNGERLWTLPAHRSAVIGVHLEGTDIVTRGFAGEISRWRLPRSEAVIDACVRHPPCAIVR